jgi:hypothetical protein
MPQRMRMQAPVDVYAAHYFLSAEDGEPSAVSVTSGVGRKGILLSLLLGRGRSRTERVEEFAPPFPLSVDLTPLTGPA